MSVLDGFSEPVELPNMPEGPGVCTIEDARGRVLQVAMSRNIRRRIGELLDSEGKIAVHGPKIYAAQQQGIRIFVRWKITPEYRREKNELVKKLTLPWKGQQQ